MGCRQNYKRCKIYGAKKKEEKKYFETVCTAAQSHTSEEYMARSCVPMADFVLELKEAHIG